MCDRHSFKYGYICHECFEELVNLGWNMDIEFFMNSDKDSEIDYDNYLISKELFEKEFPYKN